MLILNSSQNDEMDAPPPCFEGASRRYYYYYSRGRNQIRVRNIRERRRQGGQREWDNELHLLSQSTHPDRNHLMMPW